MDPFNSQLKDKRGGENKWWNDFNRLIFDQSTYYINYETIHFLWYRNTILNSNGCDGVNVFFFFFFFFSFFIIIFILDANLVPLNYTIYSLKKWFNDWSPVDFIVLNRTDRHHHVIHCCRCRSMFTFTSSELSGSSSSSSRFLLSTGVCVWSIRWFARKFACRNAN